MKAPTLLLLAACFSGCVSQAPLYYWGSYEDQIYAYMNGENQEAQLRALENDRKIIEAESLRAPPGFYAQLGLLYIENGSSAIAAACFEKEKALFPEAAVFMDYLLGKMQGEN